MSRIEGEIGLARGRTAGIDTDDIATGCVDQPEIVAAQGVHVRIGDGDGARRGDHRFDGVTAFLQHAGAGAGRQVMRRDDHAPPGSNRLQHRYGAARRQASACAAASALDGSTVTPADRKTVSCALRFCGSLSVPVTDAITAVSLRSCEASCVAR